MRLATIDHGLGVTTRNCVLSQRELATLALAASILDRMRDAIRSDLGLESDDDAFSQFDVDACLAASTMEWIGAEHAEFGGIRI